MANLGVLFICACEFVFCLDKSAELTLIIISSEDTLPSLIDGIVICPEFLGIKTICH